jgi:ergothioneine biosynthesis protein EgtB
MLAPVSGASLAERYRAVRARTTRLFDRVAPEAYYLRPIPLRHPFVFYEGHLAAFVVNKLFGEALGEPPRHAAFDRLFARGIDPVDKAAAERVSVESWPTRDEVRKYVRQVEDRLYETLAALDPDDPPHPWLAGGRLIDMLIEHEFMHQETLLYLIHQLPHDLVRPPADYVEPPDGQAPAPRTVEVPAGTALLGARPGEYRFVWDNELKAMEVSVPDFAIDATNVTNGQFMAFVEVGGYDRPEFWDESGWAWRVSAPASHPPFWRRSDGGWLYRGLFGDRPLPHAWPVFVSHAEARAFARFAGRELPTEPEWHRAAYGDMTTRYPGGDGPPTAASGNLDFAHWDPVAVGTYPGSASSRGVLDLLGNGWEWTATPFAPFPGFRPDPAYPPYSADFFDGAHFVLKGASMGTDATLTRRSFRNWFFGHYPYVYATFRLVER